MQYTEHYDRLLATLKSPAEIQRLEFYIRDFFRGGGRGKLTWGGRVVAYEKGPGLREIPLDDLPPPRTENVLPAAAEIPAAVAARPGLAARRLAICRACDMLTTHFGLEFCGAPLTGRPPAGREPAVRGCGCAVAAKALFAGQQCPLGKWAAAEPETAETAGAVSV